MHIAIFGVGAMGCLFGSRLAPHTHVTLIGHWPEQIVQLRRHPLRVITTEGREQTVTLNAMSYTQAANALPPHSVDAALILVKSGQTIQAAKSAARCLKSGGLVLTLQNGLGNLEIIEQQAGAEHSAQGVTTMGATAEEPGMLIEGGIGVTYLATRHEIHMQAQAIALLFEQSGLRTELTEDVTSLVWGKLAISAAINPLTALLRVPNGMLLASGYARGLMADAAHEVAEVAAAKEITLPYPDPAARAAEVARLTAPNKSSMLQDVLRGVPTEIDAICGAIMREGELLGIPTPVNAMFYRLVKALDTTTDRDAVHESRQLL